MHQKWSATILKELMSVAGGDPWKVHVAEAKRTGMPILPGEEIHEKAARAMTMERGEKSEQLPNLKEYLKANPHRAQREKTEGKTMSMRQKNSGEGEVQIEGEAKVEQVIGEEGSTSIPPPATPSS
jgi:small subunit ribosomal protein S25